MAPIISPAGAEPEPKTGSNTGGVTTPTTVENVQLAPVAVKGSCQAHQK